VQNRLVWHPAFTPSAGAVPPPPGRQATAVVITASLSLADIPGTARLWRQRRAEFLRMTPSLAGSRGLAGYHDVHSYPDAQQVPGLVIYRFGAPLLFANAKTFRDQIRRLAAADPPRGGS
jgi:MFS superfamily sulfate permease-like transporter